MYQSLIKVPGSDQLDSGLCMWEMQGQSDRERDQMRGSMPADLPHRIEYPDGRVWLIEATGPMTFRMGWVMPKKPEPEPIPEPVPENKAAEFLTPIEAKPLTTRQLEVMCVEIGIQYAGKRRAELIADLKAAGKL